ncbi:MAG: ABC transporter ATP-binding protein [Armatimonadota bacterium]|nr:ABC transporter ATP-binding protein [Armatimonadota bacterium]
MVEAVDLSARYDGNPVLHDLSFQVAKGEVVALLGPNGSGKSTLIRCLSGTLTPTKGIITIEGDDIAELSQKEIARRVSVVPQSEDIVFEFTVYDIVAMGRYAWGDDDNGQINWAMENAGCKDLADRKVTELSGGERQRVLFARALAQGGNILLLDEPTAHMDVGYQISTLSLVRELAREGHAVVTALHDLNLASGFADRAVLLHAGRVAAEGPVQAVLESPEIERVYGAAFDRIVEERSGRIVLIPELVPDRAKTANPLRIHFIGGGGSAGALMTEAWQLGHSVSLGVTYVGDSDTDSAVRLGVPTVTVPPHTSIAAASVAKAQSLAADADAVIVCAGPYGPGNLANLALAYMLREQGIAVWLAEHEGEWDFTDGQAARAFAAVRAIGGEALSREEMRDRLA